MSLYMVDPQTEPDHPCAICGCATFGDREVCQKCENRSDGEGDD